MRSTRFTVSRSKPADNLGHRFFVFNEPLQMPSSTSSRQQVLILLVLAQLRRRRLPQNIFRDRRARRARARPRASSLSCAVPPGETLGLVRVLDRVEAAVLCRHRAWPTRPTSPTCCRWSPWPGRHSRPTSGWCPRALCKFSSVCRAPPLNWAASAASTPPPPVAVRIVS